MRKIRISKKLIATLLCVLLALPMGVTASTIDEIKSQRQELEDQASEVQSRLATLREDEANAQSYQAALEEKIQIIEDKIDNARESIKTLNANIVTLEAKIKTAEGQYTDAMELLKQRIKALYQVGDVGTIEILLNSTSLYEFSLKTETLKSVTERDKELMDEIRGYLVATQADRDNLKAQKAEVAKIKKDLEADQEELTGLIAENAEAISALQGQQANAQSELSQIEEEDAALNAELTRLVEEKRKAEEAERKRQEEEEAQRKEEEKNNGGSTGGSSGESGGGSTSTPDTGGSTGGDGQGMSDGFDPCWPLPGYDTSWITTRFGSGGHNGLDIAGNYAAPIVAAQAGQVLSAEYHYSWGNNVLLYHNGTYQTRYAHMSSMAVSPGQYVERGQVIGYVGNTGNSFGNHLHFEVYYNDYRVDPYQYL